MALSSGSQTEALSLREPIWTSPSLTGTSTPQDLGSPDEPAQRHHNSLLISSQDLAVNAASEAAAPDNLKALNMLIRQDPFSMTLDANALLAGSLFLLMGMHFVPRFLLESFILAVPLFLLVRNDYQNFLRLGPGGTPATLAGYARLAWFRLFVLRDPFTPPTRSSSCSSSSSAASSSFSRPPFGILPRQNLPYRPGPRPTVAGIAPQRQLNQHGSVAAFTALRTTLSHLAAAQPHKFGTATSCLEKHGFALFARHPVSEHVCGNGEVCHIHNSDRSMHMNLHPDDIAEVLAKGWAERHPLAFTTAHKWWLPRSPLPETFVLVYSPRDESDLRVVCKIVEAAIWYTMEERVDIESLMFESQSQSQS